MTKGKTSVSATDVAEAPATAEVLHLSAPGEAAATAQDPIYKMQDLMQAIADKSELKRGELRAAAGLVVSAMGEALQEGRTVSLPGLGKITPRKRREKPSGDILTARIKLPAAEIAREDIKPTDDEGERGENP